MKKILLIIYIVAGALLFNACHNHEDGHDHEDEHAHDDEADAHDHGAESHEDLDEVSLTAAQMEIVGVEFVQLEKKQLTATLKANGVLKVPNQNKANVTALIGGVIQKIFVQPGDVISQGQAIASISNTSFISMQEDYLTTVSQLSLAELELIRQQELQAGNANSLKTLQAAESNVNALRTRKSSLQKQLQLLGINTSNLSNANIQSTIVIRSPIKGAVSHIDVNIGSYVDMNTTIADVVDNSKLHLDIFVYEKDLAKIAIGQTIHFTLTNNPGNEYDAKIHAISNTFEPNIKAVSVHAEVNGDKKGLIDGMNIIASVSLKEAEGLAVPTDAIVSNEGQDYILILDASSEENLFKRIPVLKGTSDVGYTEIIPIVDIAPDVKIVSKGAFFILAKMTNQGEGHSH